MPRAAVEAMKDGDVILLENTRYRSRRDKERRGISAKIWLLSVMYYVNDAFGTAHRAHCSNVGVTELCRHSSCWIPDAERDRFPRKCS